MSAFATHSRPHNTQTHPIVLLLLPTLMWMLNRHHKRMQGRVHHNLPRRGVLPWARSGRLFVLPVLASLMYVLNLKVGSSVLRCLYRCW